MARPAVKKKNADDRGGVDLAAISGLIAAITLIAVAILLGGSPNAFFDAPSIVLVLFGTIAVTAISFPFAEFLRAPFVIGEALSIRMPPTAQQVARACIMLVNKARGGGLVSLEREAQNIADKPILKRGLGMLSDGLNAQNVVGTLRLEMEITQENRDKAQGVLRRAAEVAPAMGLIGTLVGLVQMLGQLDDPSAIGPSMAVALLTTLYGAFLAHAVLTPLAERLASRNDVEAQLLEVQFVTVQSLAENENPRLLETRLNGLLPPSAQLALFD